MSNDGGNTTPEDAPTRQFGVTTGSVITERYRLEEAQPTSLPNAEVWSATDQVLDRPVQVTLLPPEQAEATLDAARRAALVNDPRLHRILDVGTATNDTGEPLHYLIHEPVGGKSLAELVTSRPLTEQHTRAVIGETAQAIDAAAKRGIHHRSLRPEHIHFDNHRLVVSGLGVDAPLADQPVLDREDSSGAVADARALAALAYYARTGHWASDAVDQAWIADSPHQSPDRDENGSIVSLAVVTEDSSEHLVDLTARALGDDAELHPKSPAEVATVLGSWDARNTLASLAGPAPRGAKQAVVVNEPDDGATGVIAAGVAEQPTQVTTPERQSVRTQRSVTAVKNPVRRIARVTGFEDLPDAPTAPLLEPRVATSTPYVAPPVQRAIVVPKVVPSRPQPVPGTQIYAVPAAAVPLDTYSLPRRRGINPTPIVLFLALAGLLAGGFYAARNIFDFVGAQVSSLVEAGTETAPEGVVDGTAGVTPGAVGDVEVLRPQIQAVTVLDPTERPENAALTIDGDPSTTWYTFTYNSPNFGGLKPGVAIQIELVEEAPVSAITLVSRESGGMVEVHRAEPGDPTAGPVLAESAFAPSTDLHFESPVTSNSFILWISELPAIGENQYRLDIEDIILH